jgi:Holliday junction resolvasome RuvABC endonuclease subunit
MNTSISQKARALAIDPTGRGFGFAVLEGTERLIDWGVKGKQGEAMRLVAELIERYAPDVIVLEDVSAGKPRRSARARRLLKSIGAFAARRKIPVRRFKRSRVKAAFLQVNAFTKHQISTVIADYLPVLSLQLPPERKAWMSEDYRMSIFDAVALAFTYFDRESKRAKAA